jgi:hypothetical protein
MMKTIAWILLGACLSMFPPPAQAADLLLPGQPSPYKGVILDVPTSFRVLQELEACRSSSEELRTYRELDRVQEAMDKVRDEREELYKQRISFLERQQEELYKLNDQAVKTAEKFSKGGSWFEKAFNFLGAMGIGGILALAAGL